MCRKIAKIKDAPLSISSSRLYSGALSSLFIEKYRNITQVPSKIFQRFATKVVYIFHSVICAHCFHDALKRTLKHLNWSPKSSLSNSTDTHKQAICIRTVGGKQRILLKSTQPYSRCNIQTQFRQYSWWEPNSGSQYCLLANYLDTYEIYMCYSVQTVF